MIDRYLSLAMVSVETRELEAKLESLVIQYTTLNGEKNKYH